LREEGRLENYTTALEKVPLILGTIPIPTSLPHPPSKKDIWKPAHKAITGTGNDVETVP